ncbi:MAG TPA: hypothetical protein VGZ73_31045, partial [Bryobacteraceae bacterium]|nr:hypothetical protein [Bryobacteraceae bacterium]
MKRLYVMAAAVSLLALVAAAQDDVVRQRLAAQEDAAKKLKAEFDAVASQMKVISLSGAAMGSTVKGAPYSAVEVSENNQVLADGTRIHNENQTTVYRDSEGRVRRETPNQITIMDPVAGVSYFLNPKTQTATKATLSMPMVRRRTGGAGVEGGLGGGFATAGVTTSENAMFEVRATKDGTTSVTVNGNPVDPSTIKMETRSFSINGEPVDERTFAMAQDKMKAAMAEDKTKAELAFSGGAGGVLRSRITSPGKTEALGKQMIEGVNADGTRFSTTLETGAIGNDRPIQMVNERWYSSELQTVVMTKHSDPRTGEEIFRLTNISRAEPGADLFLVP